MPIDEMKTVVRGHLIPAVPFGLVYGIAPVIALAVSAAAWCLILVLIAIFQTHP